MKTRPERGWDRLPHTFITVLRIAENARVAATPLLGQRSKNQSVFVLGKIDAILAWERERGQAHSTLHLNQASQGFTTGTGTFEKSLVLRETTVRL